MAQEGMWEHAGFTEGFYKKRGSSTQQEEGKVLESHVSGEGNL